MNNRISVTAECVLVGKIEEVGAKKFKKRTVVLKELEEGNKYPTLLAFTFKQERTALVSASDVGKKLTITGYVESREWQGRYYTDITGYTVERGENVRAAESEPAATEEFSDDLPF